MSTARLNHHRQFLMPSKRKERNEAACDASKPSPAKAVKPNIPKPGSPALSPKPPAHRNQLLAGYLAHEFLTKGTLFGKAWDPARGLAEPSKPSQVEEKEEKYHRYVTIADLLKTDGAHLPGVVNPTQLARFLQL